MYSNLNPDIAIPNHLTQEARDDIRILVFEMEVAKDLIGFAEHRLNDTAIPKDRRFALIEKYQDEMKTIERSIYIKEQWIQLSELEATRRELIQTHHQQLTELTHRINQIKTDIAFLTLPSTQLEAADPHPPSLRTRLIRWLTYPQSYHSDIHDSPVPLKTR